MCNLITSFKPDYIIHAGKEVGGECCARQLPTLLTMALVKCLKIRFQNKLYLAT